MHATETGAIRSQAYGQHALPASAVSAPNFAVLGFGEDARGEVYVTGNVSGTPFGTGALCSSSSLSIVARAMTVMKMIDA
jgi:hypothetical protein